MAATELENRRSSNDEILSSCVRPDSVLKRQGCGEYRGASRGLRALYWRAALRPHAAVAPLEGREGFICTSLQAVDCHLAFRICLENGLVIREGAASFAPKPEANWVRLEFPELSNAEGQSFILELRLQEPAWTTKVGLFETRHARSRVRRGARVLGVSPVNRNLFAQLVYAR